MAAYDVPRDGEGTPAGDMHPLAMDDHNTMIVFVMPRRWKDDAPEGQALRICTPEDLLVLAVGALASGTEVIQAPPQYSEHVHGVSVTAMLSCCLGARAARTKDAKAPKIIASWSPAPS